MMSPEFVQAPLQVVRFGYIISYNALIGVSRQEISSSTSISAPSWQRTKAKATGECRALLKQTINLFPKRVAQLPDGFDIEQLDECGNPGEAGGLANDIVRWTK
jgi:hypothetical protein